MHYESCIAHFMASILEQIIAGWRESESAREGERRGGGVWFCSQKMSSRVSCLQIPDYAHPYNCFTLSTDLFTLFIYSGIQQVSLFPPSTLQNHFSACASQKKKVFSVRISNLTFLHTLSKPLTLIQFGFCMCTINKLVSSVTCAHITFRLLFPRSFLKKINSPRHSIKVTQNMILWCVLIRGSEATWSAQEEAILYLFPASVDPRGYFLPFIVNCVLWKMRQLQATGWDRMPLPPPPGGRRQLESSAGLNLAKGPEEVIQLFGGKGNDDLSLCGRSHLVSQITTEICSAAVNTKLR